MKIISIIILALITTAINAFANGSCPPTTPCDGRAFPYKVCNEGKITTECLTNPSEHSNVIKVNLPLSLDKANSNYPDYVFSPSYNGASVPCLVISSTEFKNEFERAVAKWNCICGYDGVPPNENSTKIRFRLSSDPNDFEHAATDHCTAKLEEGKSCDGVTQSGITILFNGTSEYRDGYPRNTPEEEQPERPVKHVLMNNNGINTIDQFGQFTHYGYTMAVLTSSFPECDIKVYNSMDIILAQLAEVFGLGISDECGCNSSFDVTSKYFSGRYPVNDYNVFGDYYGLGGAENRQGGGDCDRYAFMLLYCPEDPLLEDCYSAVAESPVYPEGIYHPNPTDDNFHISLTMPDATHLRLTLIDIFGNTVMNIYDGIADIGTFDKDVSITNLPTGMYYIKTEYKGGVKIDKIAKY
jgi:hypothetical protein